MEYGEDGTLLPVRRQCEAYISPTCLEWRAQGYELYGAVTMARRRYEGYLKEQKRQKKLR